MHHIRLCYALTLSAASVVATAQDAPASASSTTSATPARVAKVRTVSIRPTDKVYPESLHSKGVQGVVEVLAQIGPDGFPSEVSVASTSRSKELDEVGLTVVKDLKFGVAGAANAASSAATTMLPKVLVPVEFLRDSVTTLSNKTCRDFSIDAEYFRATFPERQIGDMPTIKMTIGLLVMAETQRSSSEKIIALSKKTSAASKEIASACAAAPETLFLKLFRKLTAKSET